MSDKSQDVIQGFIAVGVAIAFFGSNYVPIKRVDTGNGLFFQWLMCCGVWMVGFIIHAIRGFPPFQPVALAGGVIWCLGNMLVVPIMRTIGMSLGLLVWSTVSLVIGWASGAFGLFGIIRQKVNNPNLNYAGVLISIFSILVYSMVSPEESSSKPEAEGYEPIADDIIRTPNQQERAGGAGSADQNQDQNSNSGRSLFDQLSGAQKKGVGFFLALAAGICFGLDYDPIQFIEDHPDIFSNVSDNVLDYVFSHFSGIFLTSTIMFLGYSMLMRDKLTLNPQLVVPSFLSGLLWAIAQSCSFIACLKLGINVGFPLISVGPGIVGAIWGIFVFREISGRKNYLALGAAVSLSIFSVVLITLSKTLPAGSF